MTHIIILFYFICMDIDYSQMYIFVLTMNTNFEPF
jgi:hypothetical protein